MKNLQLQLFPMVQPETTGETIEEKFQAFHEANPHVYDNLVRLARWAARAGRKELSMKLLFERLRWEYHVQTDTGDGYRINNSYTSRYARLIMAQCPDLAGMFETRTLRATAHE